MDATSRLGAQKSARVRLQSVAEDELQFVPWLEKVSRSSISIQASSIAMAISTINRILQIQRASLPDADAFVSSRQGSVDLVLICSV